MEFPIKIHSQREFDVVGFGTNAVDFLIQVPHYPAFNSKTELTQYTKAAGGEVATTMAGLQRLSRKTSYIGRFGDDEAGRFGLQSLLDEGVDMSYAQTIPGAHTQIAFIIIDDRNGERTVIWKRDAKLTYAADEVPLEVIQRAKILHFTPHDGAACLALARAAKSNGVIVSIDVDNIFEEISELLGYVDILFSSQDFPRRLLGIEDSKAGLRELRSRFGCAVTGVTCGEAGSLLLSSDNFVQTNAYPVPGGCKDTTGAGDAFRVGFLYGLLDGREVEEAAEMANAVASLKCRQVGARTALPTERELDEIIRESKRLVGSV